MKIEAQQGADKFLVSYGNDQGSILFLKEKVLSAPMHVESILSRGYWDDYKGNIDLKDLLSQLQVEVKLGGPVVSFRELYGTRFEEEPNCIVFRQNAADRELLYNELLKGRVRQGWGYSQEFSLYQGMEDFINSYQNVTKGSFETAQKQWNVLSKMLYIKEGDTIVIPKQPNHHHFIIATAKKDPNSHVCYEFGDPLENTNDYRHIIHIDPNSIQEVHYDSPLAPFIIKRLLKSIAYSGPINFVRNRDFKLAIEEIINENDKAELSEPHPLPQKLQRIEHSLYEEWVKTVRNLTPSDFEKLVKKFMRDNGFYILKSNSYDRKGGDIDLLCSKEIPVSTPFEPKSITLSYCIQIKKHKNLTDATGVHQLVNMEKNLNLEDSNVVQKILISLADGFTNDCEVLANDHNVTLINGIDFAQLYFKSI